MTKDEFLNGYIAAFNRGDFDGFTRFYDENVVLDLGGKRLLEGREAIRRFYTEVLQRIEETLTVDQLNRYLAAVPEARRVPLLLAGWCGLRSGEVRGLRVRDLDLDIGVVHVRQAVVRLKGQLLIGPPKTDAGVRSVSIPPHLLPALREWAARRLLPVRADTWLQYLRVGDAVWLSTPCDYSGEMALDLKEAARAVANHKFGQHFLLTEWEQVVDAWRWPATTRSSPCRSASRRSVTTPTCRRCMTLNATCSTLPAPAPGIICW